MPVVRSAPTFLKSFFHMKQKAKIIKMEPEKKTQTQAQQIVAAINFIIAMGLIGFGLSLLSKGC